MLATRRVRQSGNGRVPDYAIDVLAVVARRAKAGDGPSSYLCVDPKHACYTCALQYIAGWWRLAAEAEGSDLDLIQTKPSPPLIRSLLETTHDSCLAIGWPLYSRSGLRRNLSLSDGNGSSRASHCLPALSQAAARIRPLRWPIPGSPIDSLHSCLANRAPV